MFQLGEQLAGIKAALIGAADYRPCFLSIPGRTRASVRLIVFINVLCLLLSAGLIFPENSHGEAGNQRPLADLESNYKASVLRGWRYFQTSFAEDGMACANCHPDQKALRLWARAYPKVEVFDGTLYAVKSLKQIVLEALAKHTDVSPGGSDVLAEDLTAYIAYCGDGQPVKSGYSRTSRPAAKDLLKLEYSISRGSWIINREHRRGCLKCHKIGTLESPPDKIPLDRAMTKFPRYSADTNRVMSLEMFLDKHIRANSQEGAGLPMKKITDIMAYLARLAEGKILRPGMD
ncbi:MAG: hypothetical protein V3V37_00345 [Candidatus Adiutricales bacterium]